jgi:hypothetical protein
VYCIDRQKVWGAQQVSLSRLLDCHTALHLMVCCKLGMHKVAEPDIVTPAGAAGAMLLLACASLRLCRPADGHPRSLPVGCAQQHVLAACWCGVEEQPADVLYTGRPGLRA